MAGERLVSLSLLRGAPTAPHFVCALAERRVNLVVELNRTQAVPAACLHLLSLSSRWSSRATREAHAWHLRQTRRGHGSRGASVSGSPLLSLSSMPCVHTAGGPKEGP